MALPRRPRITAVTVAFGLRDLRSSNVGSSSVEADPLSSDHSSSAEDDPESEDADDTKGAGGSGVRAGVLACMPPRVGGQDRERWARMEG
jgi:hypothetical protein